MSVTACNFIGSTCKEDANGFANYTSTYELHTDARTDGPALVRQYPGLHQVGSTYSTPHGDVDGSATAIARDFTYRDIDETAKLWRAVIQYTNNPGQLPKRDPEDPPQLPWDEPPKISTHAVKDKEAFLLDMDGYIIASSAGEPYDPVQERDRTNYILRIERNLLFADPALNAAYRDAVNRDPVFGCDQYTVKVETPGALEQLWFGTIPYFHEIWEFAINADGWRLKLYDYGMYRKVGSGATAKLELIRDLHGAPLTAPRLLNGSGAVLPIGDSPVYVKPNIANAAQDYFTIYPELTFGALNLPQSFS
jgi:hypothetical protein